MSRLYAARRWFAALALGLVVTLVTVDFAEARRGGSFGSRGSRTFSTPAPTQTMPRTVAPVERSMTPRPQGAQPGVTSQQPGIGGQRTGGLFGGFGGGLLGGLLAGGLLGMMFGGGFGGAAGLLGFILQIAVIAVIAMLVMRFLRRRSAQPSYAGAGAPLNREAAPMGANGREPTNGREPLSRSPEILRRPLGGAVPPIGGGAQAARPSGPTDEIGIAEADLDTFERLLIEVQAAFGREDFARLRTLTTPEVMSYLAEELGENGAKGVKNEVTDVKLLQGDVSEAWREGDSDFATVAMRYESRDVMRDRATGRIVEGDPDVPTETTELWTFVRPRGGDWKLTAIQT